MWQMGDKSKRQSQQVVGPAQRRIPYPATRRPHLVYLYSVQSLSPAAAFRPFCFVSFRLVWVSSFFLGLVLSFPGQCGRLLAVAAATRRSPESKVGSRQSRCCLLFALAFPHEIILIRADLLTWCSPTTITIKRQSNRYIKRLTIASDRMLNTLEELGRLN